MFPKLRKIAQDVSRGKALVQPSRYPWDNRILYQVPGFDIQLCFQPNFPGAMLAAISMIHVEQTDIIHKKNLTEPMIQNLVKKPIFKISTSEPQETAATKSHLVHLRNSHSVVHIHVQPQMIQHLLQCHPQENCSFKIILNHLKTSDSHMSQTSILYHYLSVSVFRQIKLKYKKKCFSILECSYMYFYLKSRDFFHPLVHSKSVKATQHGAESSSFICGRQ